MPGATKKGHGASKTFESYMAYQGTPTQLLNQLGIFQIYMYNMYIPKCISINSYMEYEISKG